jgi:inorganic pyrophosphatase
MPRPLLIPRPALFSLKLWRDFLIIPIMKFDKIGPLYKNLVNAIIETPRGSQNKYDFDPKQGVFILSKTLPMGTVFPFDFGFIPGTLGEDGDPLDIMVIMEDPAYPGCLIRVRLLGVLEARQEDEKGKKIRNDRLVGVSDCSVLYNGIKNIDDLNKSMVTEIENFFIDYNKHEGKIFKPSGWKNAKKAMELIPSGN